MSNVKELTDAEFARTLESSDLPVLVDFSATWCQPCKMLAPTIDTVAQDYSDKLSVFKVDIDVAPDAAAHFGIRGVPTVIFFKDGREVDRFVGNLDLRAIKERVEKVLT